MKKKFLALFMTVSLVASLTACGGGNNGAGTESGTQSNSEATQNNSEGGSDTQSNSEGGSDTASEGDNELTVWCWDPAFNIYAMEEAAKVYQQTNPDFVLNIEEVPRPDILVRIMTAATSNDLSSLPDILLIQDTEFAKTVMTFPEVFDDLTDSGIDFDSFASAKTAFSMVDGRNYGVPFDNGAAVAALRTDVLEEAGYTLEDFTDITWDQWIEQGKDVLAKTGKPMNATTSGGAGFASMMLQSAGASYFDADGNPDLVDNELLIKTLETYKELVDTGVLLEVNGWDEYIGTIVNTVAVGTISGCWILGTIQTAEDQAGLWGVTNMPRFADVAEATNYANNGGSSWGITSNSKNKELAYDFMGSTFGGSVEFYETILESAGALSTWIPAGDSDVYAEPQEFFEGQAIYSLITDYAARIPSINTGLFYAEALDAVGTAVQRIRDGADIRTELQEAQNTVEFQMQD